MFAETKLGGLRRRLASSLAPLLGRVLVAGVRALGAAVVLSLLASLVVSFPLLEPVAIPNTIPLARYAGDTLLARSLPTAVGDEIRIGNGLGANEATLEVGVDHAGGHGCGVAPMDRPGAHLLFAGREVRLEAEQMIAGADQPIESGGLNA